ncbi:MAG: hypothetical protein ACI4D3_01220 [Lachnospiraceae bacterium]
MKYIRVLVVVLFLISAGGYAGLRYYYEQNLDDTAPVITCDTDAIEISTEDPESALLEGVTASDDKDGDITDEIAVEHIGPFLSDGSREVTYVVCDSFHNTGRAVRTLTYSDYESPRFSISSQLRFPAGKELDILQYLTAEDKLDGNLTGKIRLTHGYIPYQPEVGNYELGYQVSNSAGDVAGIDLLVEIYNPEDIGYTPAVNLSDYVVYIRKGKTFDPWKYIDNVTIGSRKFEFKEGSAGQSAAEGTKVQGLFGDPANREEKDKIIEELEYRDIYIENQVDTRKPGVYTVTYTIITQDGYTGTGALSVIVYE